MGWHSIKINQSYIHPIIKLTFSSWCTQQISFGKYSSYLTQIRNSSAVTDWLYIGGWHCPSQIGCLAKLPTLWMSNICISICFSCRRNCMAGPLPLTSTSTSASSSYSVKDTFNTVPPNNGSCQQQTSACEKTNSCSKLGSSDCLSSKIELPPQAVNTADSRKSVDIYGTLPKNQPRQFESSSASREAEVYQEFLSRQKQLNQQNGYGPSVAPSGRAYTPTPHLTNGNYQNCSQMRPSSTIPVSHSRTDSTPDSVASCDSTMTTVPGLHAANRPASSRMNRQEIRHLLQQDMIHRQGSGYKNMSLSTSNSNPNLSGSHVLPTAPSQFNQHIYTTQSNNREIDATSNRIMLSSSMSEVPQSSSSQFTSGSHNIVTTCPTLTRFVASHTSRKSSSASTSSTTNAGITNLAISPCTYTKLTTAAFFQAKPGIHHAEPSATATKAKCSSITICARPSSAAPCFQNACFNKTGTNNTSY